jgi:hypothetical protein
MIRSETNPPSDIADRADFEPFNGSREMFHISDSFEERTPGGPSRVIFTARIDRDSMWTSTVKIALRGEWL